MLQNDEPLAKLNKTFTPGISGAQKTLKNLDSGFCRNDVEGLLQEALMFGFFALFPRRCDRGSIGWRSHRPNIGQGIDRGKRPGGPPRDTHD
jgi:hypothetical protein